MNLVFFCILPVWLRPMTPGYSSFLTSRGSSSCSENRGAICCEKQPGVLQYRKCPDDVALTQDMTRFLLMCRWFPILTINSFHLGHLVYNLNLNF